MDFYEDIRSLGEKVSQSIRETKTEEAIKTAFVLPFISALGYDIFNPNEVIPEFITDYGTKKGEKVDYCIKKDNSPILIIECKHWKEDLNNHNSQLFRYFNVTDVRFAILTNGRNYQFFTDSEYSNRMDDKPFWEFDILNLTDNDIENLKRFSKENFDFDKMFRTALDLKYSKEIKKIIIKEINEPSDEFIKFFVKQIYSKTITKKTITKKVIERFKNIVKKSLNNLFDKTNENVSIHQENILNNSDTQIQIKKEDKQHNSEKFIVIDGEKIPTRYSKDILINTAEWLIRKGHLKAEDCPIFFTKNRNLINTEPIHRNQNNFIASNKLSNGLYIEKNYNATSCLKYAKLLLEKYKYSENILQVNL